MLLLNGKERGIDSCLWELIKLMNENGIKTIGCCCGHFKEPSSIVLEDETKITKQQAWKMLEDIGAVEKTVFTTKCK